MSRPGSSLPSPALVLASLSLLLVLGGTGGAAVSQAPPANSVGTKQLKNNAVATAKIKSNAVTTPKIKNSAVTAAKIAANAVTSAKIASSAVNALRIAGGAVTGDKIAPGAVTGDSVADGSIQAADLASGVVPPSNAIGRFANGPITVPTAQTTIASLSIPAAGSYVIWAKAYFTSALLDGRVTCRLEAGANFDVSEVFVTDVAPATLSAIVLNTFAAAGTVNFTCSATTAKQANFVKVVAVQVANLTNTG